jgi:transcriptional regulator GlxA family with amidase domain
MAVPLRLAICLYPGLTALDYQGPVELFGFISNGPKSSRPSLPEPLKYTIEISYLSHDLKPIQPKSGPLILPNASYTDPGQYDIVLVPGAPMDPVYNAPGAIIEFLKQQHSSAKYILSVCTGAWFLAKAGILNDKKATTNKSAFRTIEKDTEDLPITWVPKARWVVDDHGKLWTSSGVTAGTDMANAFMDHLIGTPNAEIIRHLVELSAKSQGDDPFAEYFGLLKDCGN